MSRKKIIHRGYYYDRIKHESSAREKAFIDAWEKECELRPGINSGFGLLQDLFIDEIGSFLNEKVKYVITQHDAWIVATAIQWLGSNVGMCFFGEVFEKMGYEEPRKKESP